MYNYLLRLQSVDGYRDLFPLTFNTTRFPRVLGVQHFGRNGDNPHYHFCITCDYKKDALRKYLKTKFTEGKGNKHVSLKDWDGKDQACSYLFHEGTEPIISEGFSIEEIEEYKKLNHAVKEQIKKNAPSKIVQDATEYFTPRYADGFTQHTRKEQEIFVWIMLRLKRNGDWIPNKFQITRWIDRIIANIDNDDEWLDVIDRKYSEWFGSECLGARILANKIS